MDVDTEFLEALPNDGFVRRLAWLDMSADEVPTVRIPLTQRMAMRQQHETVANKCRDRDRYTDHGGTLRARAFPCRAGAPATTGRMPTTHTNQPSFSVGSRSVRPRAASGHDDRNYHASHTGTTPGTPRDVGQHNRLPYGPGEHKRCLSPRP